MFDDRHQVPIFSVRLSFPELPAQFRVVSVLQQFGSVFGIPFLSSMDVESSVPIIRVVVSPSQIFPASIVFEWEGVLRDQQLVVSGRPNQCFSCQTLGHIVLRQMSGVPDSSTLLSTDGRGANTMLSLLLRVVCTHTTRAVIVPVCMMPWCCQRRPRRNVSHRRADNILAHLGVHHIIRETRKS